MKKKLLVLLMSIIFSIGVLYTGFGAWNERITTNISVDTAASFPKDSKSDGSEIITINQQIADENSSNQFDGWTFIKQ